MREAAELIWRHAGQETADWEAALQTAGFGEAEAVLLSLVIPEAFALPLLERLGGEGPTTLSVPRRAGGWVSLTLLHWPVYVEAVAFGREKLQAGLSETYQQIASRSSSMNSVQGAESLAGRHYSAMALVGTFAEDVGPLLEGVAAPQLGSGDFMRFLARAGWAGEFMRLLALAGWACAAFLFVFGLALVLSDHAPTRVAGLALTIPPAIAAAWRWRRGAAGAAPTAAGSTPSPERSEKESTGGMTGPVAVAAFRDALEALAPGWVVTPRGISGPGRALVQLRDAHSSEAIGHVDVCIVLDEDALRRAELWDCVVGVGNTLEERAAWAARLWSQTTGQALAEVKYGGAGMFATALRGEDGDGIRGWHAVHAPAVAYGAPENHQALLSWWLDHPVLPAISPALEVALPRTDGPHGIKLLFGGDGIAEVRIGGERHEDASRALAALPWPRLSPPAFVRSYVIAMHREAPPG